MVAILRAILLTASVLAGECGQVGHACEVQVARTMANRAAAGERGILSAYYARAPITSESAMAATLLVLRPGLLADRLYYFVWSDADRVEWGWPEGDKVLCSEQCIHLGREWPGG